MFFHYRLGHKSEDDTKERNVTMKQLQCVAQTPWMGPSAKTQTVKWDSSFMTDKI